MVLRFAGTYDGLFPSRMYTQLSEGPLTATDNTDSHATGCTLGCRQRGRMRQLPKRPQSLGELPHRCIHGWQKPRAKFGYLSRDMKESGKSVARALCAKTNNWWKQESPPLQTSVSLNERMLPFNVRRFENGIANKMYSRCTSVLACLYTSHTKGVYV